MVIQRVVDRCERRLRVNTKRMTLQFGTLGRRSVTGKAEEKHILTVFYHEASPKHS